MLMWSVPNLSYWSLNNRWKVAKKIHLSAKSTLVYSSAPVFSYPHNKSSLFSMKATIVPPKHLHSELSHTRVFPVEVLRALCLGHFSIVFEDTPLVFSTEFWLCYSKNIFYAYGKAVKIKILNKVVEINILFLHVRTVDWYFKCKIHFVKSFIQKNHRAGVT